MTYPKKQLYQLFLMRDLSLVELILKTYHVLLCLYDLYDITRPGPLALSKYCSIAATGSDLFELIG